MLLAYKDTSGRVIVDSLVPFFEENTFCRRRWPN